MKTSEKILEAIFIAGAVTPIGLGFYLTYTIGKYTTETTALSTMIVSVYIVVVYSVYKTQRTHKKLGELEENMAENKEKIGEKDEEEPKEKS